MTTESWKPITGFEAYEVSDHGRVRRGSLIKTQRADRKGYLSVTLWKAQKSKKLMVSRLVAAAFIGPRPAEKVVAHNNGNNADNHFQNLRYCTPTENEADKIAHGTQLYGLKHHQSKLTTEQVAEIKRRYQRYSRTNGSGALAREFGISKTAVHYILTGRNRSVE